MTKRINTYVIYSYVVFWLMVLGICGTATMVFHCSPLVMRILSNVCEWSPTIVLLVGFRFFCPNKTIKEFYREAFSGKLKITTMILSVGVILGATLLAVAMISVIEGNSFASYWELGTYPLWATFLFSITTGPTGEESGWRAYLRPALNE